LSKKEDYLGLTFDVMMLKDSDYPDTGIISQLEYNKLAKILMLEQLNLQSN